MKKILIILLILYGASASAQTGYTTINQRYNWLAGIFRALGLPAGGNAAFEAGQAPRAGAIYYDSTGADAGLYNWTGIAWVQAGGNQTLQEVFNTEVGGSVLTKSDTIKLSSFILNVFQSAGNNTQFAPGSFGSGYNNGTRIGSMGVSPGLVTMVSSASNEFGANSSVFVFDSLTLQGSHNSSGHESRIILKDNYIRFLNDEGNYYFPNMVSAVGTKVLRFNPSTGLITYADTTTVASGIDSTAHYTLRLIGDHTVGFPKRNGAEDTLELNLGVVDSIGRRIGVDSFDVYESGVYAYSVKDSIGVSVDSTNGSSFTGAIGAANVMNSNFYGNNAGSGATNATESNFFGFEAGLNATNANQSNFFGNNAGSGATGAFSSNFFGTNAGKSATGAEESTFMGDDAGAFATNATKSIFIGTNAGDNADSASNSIFLGEDAGNELGLSFPDKTHNFGTNDYSILIGRKTRTGGFTNSVLLGGNPLGGYISNTSDDQMMFAPNLVNFRISDFDYTLSAAGDTLATRAYARDEGGGGSSNLIVQNPPGSVGTQIWYDSGDTLYLKKVYDSAFVRWVTLADSSLVALLSATGTPSSTTYLRGDNTWATVPGGGDVNKVGTPVDNQVGVWTGDGTLEGDVDFIFDGSNLGVGGTPGAKLDLWTGNVAGMLIGGDLNALTRTDNTNKFGRIAGKHYDNEDEPIALLSYSATSGANDISYGLGVNPGMNGAGSHNFYTSANNTTLGGTLRVTVANTILNINASLADFDVRIGGDTDADLLRTDASVDRVLIGTAAGSGTEKLSVTGNVALLVAGNKLKIATGSNASIGVSGAMTAGTITISTTAVATASIIILTHATLGGTQGILSVGTITNGTSFVINSSSGTDTGTVNWWIIN